MSYRYCILYGKFMQVLKASPFYINFPINLHSWANTYAIPLWLGVGAGFAYNIDYACPDIYQMMP